MFLLPTQQIAAALMVKRIGDSASDAAHNAGEAAETLKRIEEQNKETLKRIESQNIEIKKARKSQPNSEANVADIKLSEEAEQSAETNRLEAEREAKKFSKAHPTMLICPKCNNATFKKTKKCRHCGYIRS